MALSKQVATGILTANPNPVCRDLFREQSGMDGWMESHPIIPSHPSHFRSRILLQRSAAQLALLGLPLAGSCLSFHPSIAYHQSPCMSWVIFCLVLSLLTAGTGSTVGSTARIGCVTAVLRSTYSTFISYQSRNNVPSAGVLVMLLQQVCKKLICWRLSGASGVLGFSLMRKITEKGETSQTSSFPASCRTTTVNMWVYCSLVMLAGGLLDDA